MASTTWATLAAFPYHRRRPCRHICQAKYDGARSRSTNENSSPCRVSARAVYREISTRSRFLAYDVPVQQIRHIHVADRNRFALGKGSKQPQRSETRQTGDTVRDGLDPFLYFSLHLPLARPSACVTVPCIFGSGIHRFPPLSLSGPTPSVSRIQIEWGVAQFHRKRLRVKPHSHDASTVPPIIANGRLPSPPNSHAALAKHHGPLGN